MSRREDSVWFTCHPITRCRSLALGDHLSPSGTSTGSSHQIVYVCSAIYMAARQSTINTSSSPIWHAWPCADYLIDWQRRVYGLDKPTMLSRMYPRQTCPAVLQQTIHISTQFLAINVDHHPSTHPPAGPGTRTVGMGLLNTERWGTHHIPACIIGTGTCYLSDCVWLHQAAFFLVLILYIYRVIYKPEAYDGTKPVFCMIQTLSLSAASG